MDAIAADDKAADLLIRDEPNSFLQRLGPHDLKGVVNDLAKIDFLQLIFAFFLQQRTQVADDLRGALIVPKNIGKYLFGPCDVRGISAEIKHRGLSVALDGTERLI